MAQVMNIGDYDDVKALAHQVGDQYLRDVLNNAEIGLFNERSWVYWHYRLGLAAPGRVPTAYPQIGMTDYFKPRMDILPPAQQRLWPELHPSIELGLVLHGGTAIALRLGHRPSADFDFFTDKPLDKAVLQSAFPFLQRSTVLQDEPNTYTVLVPCGTTQDQHLKVSFFGTIGFGRIGDAETTEDGTLQVATLDDLMATKVKVILQRIEAKDYRDIAAMVKAGVSLSKGVSAARAMYGLSFQPSESLKAMVYFEGGDLHTLMQSEKEGLIAAASAVRDLPTVEIVSRELATRSI